jgi:malonate transporter
MLAILTITGPIYLLILLGFASVRLGWFAKADMRVLGQFVVRIALPAMLFRVLSRQPVAQVLDARLLLAYALGSLLALGAGWYWGRQRTGTYRAMLAMGMGMSNSGFVGAPVLLQWLGPAAGSALAMTMMVENLLVLPLCLTLAELGHQAAQSAAGSGTLRPRSTLLLMALRPLLRNPMLWAIVIGVAFAALELSLPPVLSRSVDLLANASAGAALVVIGGSLVGLKLGGQRLDLAAVTLGKLLIHPLAVGLLLAWLAPTPSVVHTALIALAAMPMLSIYPVLAQKFAHDGFCAAALLVVTVVSFFSLSALLALLPWLGAATS